MNPSEQKLFIQNPIIPSPERSGPTAPGPFILLKSARIFRYNLFV